MRKQKPPLVTTTIKQPKGACIEQQGNFDFRPTNLVVRDCIRLWEKTTEILQENESHEKKNKRSWKILFSTQNLKFNQGTKLVSSF